MTRIALDFSDVGVVVGGSAILRGLNWRVGRGESWAVIGPNGAGKTTLLSIINGYRWPTRGSVSVLGEGFGDVDLRELRGRIGMVSPYLNEWISGTERVSDLVISGKYASTRIWTPVSADDVRYSNRLLRLMGCLKHRERRMREISQGERQKVLIARALMARPELLTLDEPCEGLDMKSREEFLKSLSKLAMRRELSIIDVTHRTEEIPEGFTHALLLKDGSAVTAGPIGRVLTAENLSRCFETSVRVRKMNGRYYTIV